MQIPKDYWELLLGTLLFVLGNVIYVFTTRDKSSFVNTYRCKIIRRIIELIFVLVSLSFIIYDGWNSGNIFQSLLIALPVLGFLLFLSITRVMRIAVVKKRNEKVTTKKMTEHLLNIIIFTIFFLSAIVILLIFISRLNELIEEIYFLLMLLDLLLSINITFILFHLYFLIVITNISNEKTPQIVDICRELNE